MKNSGNSLACAVLLALFSTLAAGAQSWDAGLGSELDKMSANAWQPSLLTAFGTFTYADTGLPSPFSRYLEDGLKASFPKSKRLKLFNKSVAAAMDPAFRSAYGDFFQGNTNVDALLSGRYYVEGQALRARLELTGFSDGVLIGTADLRMPLASIPPEATIDPSAEVLATASSIGKLASDSGKGALKVSVSTDRGAGAVYREGERMVVLASVNKAAWLKVYHIDATGVLRLIYPNAFTSGRRLEPGAVVRIPGPDDNFAFDMVPPFGTEFIKIVASTQPFSASETAVGGQAFAELGKDLRGAMTRGIKVSASGSAEKAEAMASYVIVAK
jgi:hypothetical protein